MREHVRDIVAFANAINSAVDELNSSSNRQSRSLELAE